MRVVSVLRRAAEWFVGALMALMFLTFVLQIAIRYTARLDWMAEAVPLLDPSLYGWTLEFCLLLWVWIIFAGCAFVVRDQDHVTFDVLYNHVRPGLRRWFVILGGIAIAGGLLASMGPTWEKFHILRLKRTATLSGLFGDWIRMRDIYGIYMLFLVAVSLRYAWAALQAIRGAAEPPVHHGPGRMDE
ncbi:MAG: TRAP transporter small permease subunit [Pseudomonadota bacterium]